ncbi:HAD-IA family hydrolase [Granulibacter bethesdensis]|uniref:HAD-IA family hydrolase n=1 Tax=Granulibacter bethesdensis TaxID=364410 RepID=UPI0003F1D026|nr:HAD-IA family hydrolase [Granulibacter bethesdensis]AHJ66323.1 Phosphoglycolate phosphatase [Granulibacter bethesdensis CGDNIH4]
MRTVLLDLDGTLVDSLPDITNVLNGTLQRAGLPSYTQAEVGPMVGDGARALLTRAANGRGATLSEAMMQDFMAAYADHATSHSRLYPDVPDTLAELKKRGWTLLVCTNKPAVPAQIILENFEIASFFAGVGAGDSFPVRKPDPGHLLSTLALAGMTPEGAIMVGDHSNDIDAAASIPIPSVWARWGYGTDAMGSAATAIAERFSDLPDLLESLMPVT